MAGAQLDFGRYLRGLIPALITLFLVLVGMVPLGLPAFPAAGPLLTLASVFYWSIYRPELMPAMAAFALGVAHDFISGGPIGLTPLLLLLVHGFCLSQRQVFLGRSFGMDWGAFFVVAAGAALLAWVIACIYFLQLIDPRPSLIQLGLTVAFYPVLNWLFSRTEITMLRRA